MARAKEMTVLRSLALLLVLLLASNGCHQAQRQESEGRSEGYPSTFGEGDIPSRLISMAEKGDPLAQYALGTEHVKRQQFQVAADWFQKAAKQGGKLLASQPFII